MKKILQLIWHGCWHDWKHISTGRKTLDGMANGNYYVYQCKKCDRIEERNKGW